MIVCDNMIATRKKQCEEIIEIFKTHVQSFTFGPIIIISAKFAEATVYTFGPNRVIFVCDNEGNIKYTISENFWSDELSAMVKDLEKLSCL